MVYFDNAATTKIHPEVLEAMLPFLTDNYGNPGTMYAAGRMARGAVEHAREQVAAMFHCSPSQVIFTSGGSEGNNMVLREFNAGIVSTTEHDSVLRMAEDSGEWIESRKLGVCREGFVTEERAKAVFEHESNGFGRKIFASVMYVNNETGAVNDIPMLAALAHRNRMAFHTDCVQAAGTHELDVGALGCDFATVSSHKIHGPKGVGAVFTKNANLLDPLIWGGTNQEFGLRGGTENVAGIVGFGKACELLNGHEKENLTKVSTVKEKFYQELLRSIGDLREIMHVNGPSVMEPGKVLNLRFDGLDGETLVLAADLRGLCISVGSACTSGDLEPSHVLLAMGLSEDEARSSVRVSFSVMNTLEEAVEGAEVLADCVRALHRET